MKELRSKQGELTGYKTERDEILIHGHIHYPDHWMLTIRKLEIFGRRLCVKDCDIEQIKDKVYALLDEKETEIEKLKKLIAK